MSFRAADLSPQPPLANHRNHHREGESIKCHRISRGDKKHERWHWTMYSGSGRAKKEGLEEVDDGIWSIHFCNVLLGRIDERDYVIRA
jgi:hypothetical protein